MTPAVSVVIATRNRWPLLSTLALPSALAQEQVELELIVVDDASTDDTETRLRELSDPRLRVIRHPRNWKLPASRNTGIAAARGEWVAFLDDDDVWAPRKLRLQLDAAAEQGAEWVYGAALVVDLESRVLGRDPLPEPEALAGLLQTGNYVPGGGSNVVVRAEAVRGVGGFDEQLRFFEDWDLWLRLLEVGPPAVCREVVMARLEHPGNMVLRDADEVLPAFERLVGKRRPVTRDDRLGILQWLAYEQHRARRRRRASSLYLRAAVMCRSPGNVPPAVGVLFGERGMRITSRILKRLGGASHIEPDEQVDVPTPPWLARRARPAVGPRQ